MTISSQTQPALYIPHGGGPCFFMDDPRGMWSGMEKYLRSIAATLPAKPKAILVISAHWETDGFSFTSAKQPHMIYDYYGFPAHTYELQYPSMGDPALAAQAADLLNGAGIKAQLDSKYGYDHGVFVPLLLAFPDADIPVVEMSIDSSLDPALHLAAGRALAPLRDEGVLIIGSGMSFHNMRAYGNPASTAQSEAFDAWLSASVCAEPAARDAALIDWKNAPAGRFSHPREEHLIPLMVAAGTSSAVGIQTYNEKVLETAISGFSFGWS